MFVFLVAAQLLAPAAKPFPAPAKPPPISSLFTANDYPPQARMNHWEGAVKVKVVVGTNGHVTDCTVIQSSGYQVLDDTTCKILTKRAPFKPARNSLGEATLGYVTMPDINWRYSP